MITLDFKQKSVNVEDKVNKTRMAKSPDFVHAVS